jgi:hypothetical protein
VRGSQPVSAINAGELTPIRLARPAPTHGGESMGWSLGFDSTWDRDIGYGVPACCDFPGCGEKIDRGLSHVCGGEPYGGDRGCGLYFCGKHLHSTARLPQLCARCYPKTLKPFDPTPDHPEWINFKLTDRSWVQWRKENPEKVMQMRNL